jgi:uncharacterized protein YndB with AHSA1/START domain
VFQAFTDPELIPQWWGPRGITTTVDKMDVRVGGDWRFTCDGPDGATAVRGTYREITPPELMESGLTESYERLDELLATGGQDD